MGGGRKADTQPSPPSGSSALLGAPSLPLRPPHSTTPPSLELRNQVTKTQSHYAQVSRRDSTPLPSGKSSWKRDPPPQLSERDTWCVRGSVGSRPPLT